MKRTSIASILLITVLLASCSGGSAEPTATPVDVNALQTAAVQTVIAAVTETAVSQPTATAASPTETPAPALTETETATPAAAAATQQTCDNSAFINDTSVPDGTVMAAGQDFIKTWKVKNSGTCNWTTGYNIVYAYGEKMGGAATPLTAEVTTNSDAEISINLKAPLKSGTYSGYWRLANNNGFAFGEIFTVVITVP